MTCEECEEKLASFMNKDGEVLRHVETCSECQKAHKVLAMARLPSAPAGALDTFAASTRKVLKAQAKRKAGVRWGVMGAMTALAAGWFLWGPPGDADPSPDAGLAAVEFGFDVSVLFDEDMVGSTAQRWEDADFDEVAWNEEEMP